MHAPQTQAISVAGSLPNLLGEMRAILDHPEVSDDMYRAAMVVIDDVVHEVDALRATVLKAEEQRDEALDKHQELVQALNEWQNTRNAQVRCLVEEAQEETRDCLEQDLSWEIEEDREATVRAAIYRLLDDRMDLLVRHDMATQLAEFILYGLENHQASPRLKQAFQNLAETVDEEAFE